MYDAVLEKFRQNPDIRAKLIETRNQDIREMTVKELESFEWYVIGELIERKAYYPAIIGKDKDKNEIKYPDPLPGIGGWKLDKD